jgi:hypothetical protein
MRPKLLLTISTYALLSLVGGGSFMLPDELVTTDVQITPVTPALTRPRLPMPLPTARATTDDVALDDRPDARASSDGDDAELARPVS